jgi:hypothetical protein
MQKFYIINVASIVKGEFVISEEVLRSEEPDKVGGLVSHRHIE